MNAAIRPILAAVLLMAVAAVNAQDDSTKIIPTTPITAENGQETQRDPEGRKIVELPSSDSFENFSYHVSKDNSDVVVIVPADGSSNSYVSKGFLGMVMNEDISNSTRLEQLKAYEIVTAQARADFMTSTFPGAEKETKPYVSSALRAGENDVILEQDPKAGPYVRVTVTDKTGNIVKEFSIAKSIADEIMNHPHMTIEQKLEVLGQTMNHLPEEIRERFAGLSREEMEALIDKKPEVARQEFSKMLPVFAEAKKMEEERRSRRITALKQMPVSSSVGSSRSARNSATRASLSTLSEKTDLQKSIAADTSAATSLSHGRSWDSALIRLASIFLLGGLIITAVGFLTRNPVRS